MLFRSLSLSLSLSLSVLFLSTSLCLSPPDLVSLFDLEDDLPDELIRNGDMVPDAAAKHKQLSELLRAGSSSSLGGGLNSSPGHPSPQGQKGGQGNGGPGMGGFGQAMMNSGQVMGQVMNGGLGPAGRGRPGMQYQGQASAGGSVLAETLTQGGAQMGAHNAMNAQQAGNMNCKVCSKLCESVSCSVDRKSVV